MLEDAGRFELAVWLALTELGLGPYPAAYLTIALITSDRPITTESIDGALLKSTTLHRGRVLGHADRIRRKAPEAIARANENERAWLFDSANNISLLLVKLGANDAGAAELLLKRMRAAGWTEVLDQLSRRIDQSLRSNFPPADGPLSRAAARLLRHAKEKAA
ncbi:MAG: hypothetical protein WA268_15475 [Xanthobacteraceae bacterium]